MEGLFESDKSKKEIDEILRNLGFSMFKYDEVDTPNLMKKTNMGRPLKYSTEMMSAVVNREYLDSQLMDKLGVKSENLVRNHRSRWTKVYPELVKEVKKWEKH